MFYTLNLWKKRKFDTYYLSNYLSIINKILFHFIFKYIFLIQYIMVSKIQDSKIKKNIIKEYENGIKNGRCTGRFDAYKPWLEAKDIKAKDVKSKAVDADLGLVAWHCSKNQSAICQAHTRRKLPNMLNLLPTVRGHPYFQGTVAKQFGYALKRYGLPHR